MTIPSSDAGDPTDLWPVGKPCITALPHHTRPCAPQPADGVRCRCTRPKRSVVWSDRFKSTEGERFGQICPNLLSAHRSPVTAPPRPLSKSRSRCQHGPRQKIIDSAFKMTEQLVGTSTQLAEKIVKVGQNVLSESEKDG